MVKYHVRKDKLAQLSFRCRPSLADAIVDVAADRQTYKEHVIIEALVAYMKRRGLWPPSTLEDKQCRRERAIARKKAQEARQGANSTNSGQRGGKPSRVAGRPIGGPREGMSIGDRRRGKANRYKPHGGYTP